MPKVFVNCGDNEIECGPIPIGTFAGCYHFDFIRDLSDEGQNRLFEVYQSREAVDMVIEGHNISNARVVRLDNYKDNIYTCLIEYPLQ